MNIIVQIPNVIGEMQKMKRQENDKRLRIVMQDTVDVFKNTWYYDKSEQQKGKEK